MYKYLQNCHDKFTDVMHVHINLGDGQYWLFCTHDIYFAIIHFK